MGQVWLAEQTIPIRRNVALKLIKGGSYDDAVMQRFESERQSLAVMDHPSIAKVFDAGTTPDGQPYFVMEYVPGVPITQYCDQRKLSPRERLRLFILVCSGVQHAHQKAIIHRDLKPSNILVVEVDGKPTPRIIDFGIAKAISQQAADQTFTQAGALLGTPGYMSPEQADSGSRDLDTRTDVYSLGVILYELLSGSTPIDTRNQPLRDVLRQLHQDDPPTPSARFGGDRETAGTTAEMRGMDTKRLVNLLRGDLDWITMKALERDRAWRYDSPAALAADIQRYLANEVVLATPPSFSYRSSKFVQRHRVSVIAASAVFLMLIVLAASMTWQTLRIARERDRANREAVAAENVSSFLTGLFNVSSPSEARGNSITAREILDKGAKEIETNLAAQPEVQARLMATMGNVYTSLGLLKPARRLQESALATRRRVLGAEHPETLTSQSDLGWLNDREGQYGEAKNLLQKTLEVQRRVLGAEHSDTLNTSSHLGSVYVHQGRYADAEKLISSALDISRRTRGEENAGTLNLMNTLAVAYDGQHKYAEEERLQRQLVQTKQRVLGPDDPATIVSTQNLAYVMTEQGKYKEAEILLRDVLQTARRVLGPEHQDTLQVMNNLAGVLERESRFSEAEKLYRRTLEIRNRTLGPDHPDTLYSINNLGGVLSEERRYDEAEKLFREALERERKVLGEDHPDIGTVWYNLAEIEEMRGHRQQALALLHQAVNHGYTDVDFMTIDDAWNSMRGDPEYQVIVSELRRRTAAVAKESQ